MYDTTWVLVADGFLARLFRVENVEQEEMFTEVETMTNPADRLHDTELLSDAYGRNSGDTYTGHKKENDIVRDTFAREIGKKLEQLRVEGKLARLYIIAEPGFIGLLRKHLSKSLKNDVAAEITHDLVREDAKEIRKLLPRRL